MKKWLVTIAALWLVRDAAPAKLIKNYYQLPVVQSGTQSTASQGQSSVMGRAGHCS